MGSDISGKNDVGGSESVLEEVLDRKEILEKIIDNSPVIAFLWKAEDIPEEKWPVEYVSGNVGLLGYTVDDFVSGRLLYADIIHPDDRRMVQESLTQRCRQGLDFFDQKYRIILKSGDMRWIDERTYIQRD
ncbi:PAS domain-containing protein, partial [Methanomethylovorans sp.]|uniref:PAS domain-containing protein n=1 Tax=Methanomethylovorans sp. TaxID=2758717 RepID=UPI00351C3893